MSDGRTELDWLAALRAAIAGGAWDAAQTLCTRARTEHPGSAELSRVQAGIDQHAGRNDDAELLYRQLLAARPEDAASAFALARLLGKQGRNSAAAGVIRTCFAGRSHYRQSELVIDAIELLDDCGRKADAAAIAGAAATRAPRDMRLHVYAGMLCLQLGNFSLARNHYLQALSGDSRAWGWHVPLGLANAQRYTDDRDPDLALFHAGLERTDLSDAARAELHFALGKAHDDLGQYHAAAQHLRTANLVMHRITRWSRKEWQRLTKARLGSVPLPRRADGQSDFIPIFIIGMPRSGTTLLAMRLSAADPRVCNRGELGWIEHLAARIVAGSAPSRNVTDRAAATYAAHLRQDDANGAHWFIDKQPLNFRYVDLIIGLFPEARIIRCRRGTRDTAVSLWMQCFIGAAHGYAYDFGDMAQVMRDEDRLMTHWEARYPDAIREVHYEDVVARPEAVVADLGAWLGFSASAFPPAITPPPSVIATSSLWQARQPVYARSIGRWRHYASDMPELLHLPE